MSDRVHTWMICPECRQNVRASRHAHEDCETMLRLQRELDNLKHEMEGMVTREEDGDEIIRLGDQVERVRAYAAKIDAWMDDPRRNPLGALHGAGMAFAYKDARESILAALDPKS